jgi:hypothetical protein
LLFDPIWQFVSFDGRVKSIYIRVMIKRSLLIPVFLLLFFFQLESPADFSLFWLCSTLGFTDFLIWSSLLFSELSYFHPFLFSFLLP